MIQKTATPYQSAVEDFIKTAETNGYTGHALLSSSHPKIKDNSWTQIRTLMFGILAYYFDELGLRVELVTVNGKNPVVRQSDRRTMFYVRLKGSTTGFAFKAMDRKDARKIAAAKLEVPVDSAYITICTKPTLGVCYGHQ